MPRPLKKGLLEAAGPCIVPETVLCLGPRGRVHEMRGDWERLVASIRNEVVPSVVPNPGLFEPVENRSFSPFSSPVA